MFDSIWTSFILFPSYEVTDLHLKCRLCHHNLGHISGVVVDGQKIAADVVILSMGPWGEVLQQAVPASRKTSARASPENEGLDKFVL